MKSKTNSKKIEQMYREFWPKGVSDKKARKVKVVKKDTGWTKKWPTVVGRYWFYGWPYGDIYKGVTTDEIAQPELSAVEVWKGGPVVREGNFWYEANNPIGFFHKADVPEFPSVLELIPKKRK